MRASPLILLGVVALGGGILEWAQWRAADRNHRAESATGGRVAAGKDHVVRYGCIACHLIPGIPGPHSKVGPPLSDYAHRTYVAGVAANTPDALAQFIREPRRIAPQSAMPNVGVSAGDARDIVAFLYTLQ